MIVPAIIVLLLLCCGILLWRLLEQQLICRRLTGELRAEEQQLYLLTDNLPDVVARFDRELRHLYVNRAVERVTGRPRESFIGKSNRELGMPEEQLVTWEREMREVFADGAPRSYEFSFVSPAGETYYYESRIIPERRDDGRFDTILTIARDITQRHRAEAALRDSEELFALFMRFTPVYTFIKEVKDGVSTVLRVSDNYERMIGRRPEELIGRTMEELFPPDFAAKINADDAQVVREQKIVQLAEELHGRHYTTIKFPLNRGDGTQLLAGFTIDITEQRLAEERMLRDEKLLLAAELAAGMAHELNNPLAIVAQAAQNIELRLLGESTGNRTAAERHGLELAILKDYLADRSVPELLSAIREASGRASHIVTTLGVFSHSSSESRQPTELAPLLERTLVRTGHLREIRGAASINIERHFATDLPPVPVAVAEIEQVATVLLRNAMQAVSGDGVKSPTVVVGLRRVGSWAEIEVTDNGVGIVPELRQRIFDPFFSTREPGEGSGLGLSVAYMIVTRNHQGEMEVISTPGCGARFIVRLPLEIGRTQPLGALRA